MTLLPVSNIVLYTKIGQIISCSFHLSFDCKEAFLKTIEMKGKNKGCFKHIANSVQRKLLPIEIATSKNAISTI